jgi:hypothetical protein
MADVKISGLPASTTPLAGTEVLPIVQGGQTRQVSVNNLTNGKAVSALSVTATTVNGTTFDTNVATAGVTLAGTTLAADGTDANINISLVPKGTGQVVINAGTASLPAIAPTGDPNTGVFFPAADTIAFSEGGAESMRIDSSGNVGIGVNAPATRLDLAVGADGSGNFMRFVGAASQPGTYNLTLKKTQTNEPNGGAPTYNYAFSQAQFGGNNGNAVVLNWKGNLGLGLTPSDWVLSGYKAFEISKVGNGLYSGNGDIILSCNAYFNSGWKYGQTGITSGLYTINGNVHKWSVAPAGTAGNAITLNQAMTLHASGGLSLGDTTDPSAGNLRLGTGNLVIGTSGKGIDFSATPGTGTSELLNDYEEGTWAPNFAAWATAPTSVSDAYYTKIGRQVTVCFTALNGVCANTGQPVAGLPFTALAASVASFRDVSGGGTTTFGAVSGASTQVGSITAANFTGLFWTMSATYFV